MDPVVGQAVDQAVNQAVNQAVDQVVDQVVGWYAANARDLPWRAPDTDGWAVLVSEVMLQQTPVARVLPVYESWLARWPTPAALAADSPGDAVLAWGRLGYPRRALRLHEAAVAIRDRHAGTVPADYDALRALPGIGDYTAAAVASFAYGRRHVVLDTNVRRVLARVVSGRELPGPSVTAAERALATDLLPPEPRRAALWAVASMELGALICTARTPRCERCPITVACAWHAAGRPADDGPPRKVQTYAGTDRQVRGRLLAVLRAAAPDPVDRAALDAAWHLAEQRGRALDGLIADGLVEAAGDGCFRLPGVR
jgi:A/G-specific adenine glycosylase